MPLLLTCRYAVKLRILVLTAVITSEFHDSDIAIWKMRTCVATCNASRVTRPDHADFHCTCGPSGHDREGTSHDPCDVERRHQDRIRQAGRWTAGHPCG